MAWYVLQEFPYHSRAGRISPRPALPRAAVGGADFGAGLSRPELVFGWVPDRGERFGVGGRGRCGGYPPYVRDGQELHLRGRDHLDQERTRHRWCQVHRARAQRGRPARRLHGVLAEAESSLMRMWAKTIGLAALAVLIAGALPARADGPAPKSYVGGLKLVWGSVPLPDFRMGFQEASVPGGGLPPYEPGSTMMLSLSDYPGQQFSFTPRTP